jgi:basic membrane protein A and related proteins
MARRWPLAALLALVVVLAGCGGGDGGGSDTTASTTGGSEASGAIVTDTAGLNDRSFNHLANLGRLRAQNELGMKTQAYISKSSQDYLPNMTAAAQDGHDIVVANGFLLASDLASAASQFPDTNWAIVDFPWVALTGKPKNVVGLTFKSEQSGYLVGYLGALMTKRQGGPQVMSAVGGQKIPSVDSWIAGYRAGAKAANPNVRVEIAYSGQFPPSAAPKCKELALKQIADGSQVVFQVAGGCGLGALDAAKQKGKWGIGVDADQSYLGPSILTSGIKKVDVAVYTAMKQTQDRTFKGGRDLVFDLKNGGVGVGKINPKVPAGLVAQMRAQEAKLRSGEITAPATL